MHGGVLVQRDDVVALQVASAGLLKDTSRAAALGRQGRAAVAREHSWDRVAQRLIEVYRRVLGA